MRNLDERDDRAGRLAAALQCSAPAGAGSACPDAADLAAWLDAPSGSPERRSLDEHVACCPRCQQVTAAFAKTTPPGSEVVPSPVAAGRPVRRRIGLWAWLLPAAATTAAALAWFVVRPLVVAPVQGPSLQSAETTQAAATEPKDAVGAAQVDQAQRSREEASASNRMLAEAPGTVAPDTERRDSREPVTRTARKSESTPPAPLPAAAPVSPAPLPVPPARAQQPPPAVPVEARVAEREVPPPMRAEELKVAGQAAAPTTVARTTGLAAAADTIGADEAAEFTVISASEPAARWRVRRGSLLERSDDGGTTWSRVGTAVPRGVLAGSAPSPDVCWLVGRRGLVLRVGPGTRLDVTAPPVDADLVRIIAQDARTAAVTTRDGDVYRTTDGGATWQR